MGTAIRFWVLHGNLYPNIMLDQLVTRSFTKVVGEGVEQRVIGSGTKSDTKDNVGTLLFWNLGDSE